MSRFKANSDQSGPLEDQKMRSLQRVRDLQSQLGDLRTETPIVAVLNTSKREAVPALEGEHPCGTVQRPSNERLVRSLRRCQPGLSVRAKLVIIARARSPGYVVAA